MIHLYQNRFAFGDESTLSTFHIRDEFKCFMIEDQVREGPKVYGETAIPVGTYEVELRTVGGLNDRYTNRYYGDPDIDWIGILHLQDVPGFTFIEVHPGNTDEDTAGCPLPGFDPKRIDNKNNFELFGSGRALKLIYPTISKEINRGEKVLWHIKNQIVI